MINQRKAGVILTYAWQATQAIIGLIYTPIMLRILGRGEYGLYQLVYSVVSYLGLLSFGFNASYMRFYSKETVEGDEDGIANLNGMFFLIFAFLSIICLICGAFMIANIECIFRSGLTTIEYQKAKTLMVLMVINISLTFPNSVFTCIISSQERFIFLKLLILLQAILNPFLALPLLLMGYGSIGMVSVTTALTFCVLIINAYYCRHCLNSRFAFRALHFSRLREMWVFTFYIFINQIIDLVNWNVDKYLLGRLSGTIPVAIYSVGGQINSMYLQSSTAISNVYVPHINKVIAEAEDNEKITDIFIKVGRIQFIVLSLILGIFICFGKPFIRLWIDEGYDESYYVALLLLIPATVPLIQNIGIEIQRAKNMHKARSIVYLLVAITNILISIPLISDYGPVGAAIGTAISLVVGNGLFMNWYYYRYLKINIPLFWKNIIKLIPASLITFTIGFLASFIFNQDTWGKLISMICAYTIVFCFFLYITGLNDNEKKKVNSIAERINRWSRKN